MFLPYGRHSIGGTTPGCDGVDTPVGFCAWSDAATFSFHPVKTIAMGEGGAVTTRNAAVAERLRLLRSHGITRDPKAFVHKDAAFGADGRVNPWYYEMQVLGHNYRAPDINCALGLSQLKKLDLFAAKRRGLVAAYDEKIASLAPIVRPLPRMGGQETGLAYLRRAGRFPGRRRVRADAMRRLAEKGIGSQVHYIPVPDQPYWRARVGTVRYPGAKAYYESVLTLPLFVEMGEEDVDRVIAALSQTLGL